MNSYWIPGSSLSSLILLVYNAISFNTCAFHLRLYSSFISNKPPLLLMEMFNASLPVYHRISLRNDWADTGCLKQQIKKAFIKLLLCFICSKRRTTNRYLLSVYVADYCLYFVLYCFFWPEIFWLIFHLYTSNLSPGSFYLNLNPTTTSTVNQLYSAMATNS